MRGAHPPEVGAGHARSGNSEASVASAVSKGAISGGHDLGRVGNSDLFVSHP